jgi:hypothetical protein
MFFDLKNWKTIMLLFVISIVVFLITIPDAKRVRFADIPTTIH